ncbi:ADP-ribosylation factor 1 [Elysia marginata]|uniref:ADP-ribosylation factor 1 n=1 Tax=Elysia marginata TaxID=1093978 RepID=A0AAV4H8V5_9GAST|nr:ADP-ribosylation factor 1 [Elysia marginata]
MGNWFCKRVDTRILIQGLDAAGKTSLLYRLKLGEIVTTIPTIGFNVETIVAGGLTITCWDLGGRDKIRPLYRHYYPNTQGFVYVIDSADKERLDDALDELVRFVFLEEESANTVVMILANKQDIPGAMTALEIEEALKQKYKLSPSSSHTVFVRPCSVISGEGVYEAFDEFSEQLRLKRAGKTKPGLLRFAGEETNAHVENGPKNNASLTETVGPKKNSDSLAMVNAKNFFRDPFSYMKSIFFRLEA